MIRRLATIYFVTLCIAFCVISRAQDHRSLTIPDGPSWISGATWGATEDRVIVSDPSQRRLLFFKVTENELVRETTPKKLAAIEADGVLTISKFNDGFIVKTAQDQSMLRFNKEWESVGHVNPHKLNQLDSGLGSLYSNWTSRGSKILGYGSITNTPQDVVRDRKFKLGIVMAELSANGATRWVRLLYPTEYNDYYLLNNRYFTSNDANMFFVLMEEKATLYRVTDSGDLSRMNAFPVRFRSVPGILIARKTTQEVFAQLEAQAVAAGVIGYKDSVYVLTREPLEGDGGTRWLLFRIDPQSDAVVGHVELPTTKNHIVVVPGEFNFLILEGGPVRAWGRQSFETAVVVNSNFITGDG